MNTKAAGIILSTSLAVLLASCASAPEEEQHYLLSSTAEDNPVLCGLSIGRVTIPAYLRRSSIIVQTGDSQLTPALSHRWSEPLSDGIRRVLSQCMDGSSDQSVNIDIKHLHGSTTGRTHLEAQWMYQPSQTAGQFSEAMQQSGPGYEPLVASHRQLLSALCREVCANRPRALR